MLRANMTENTYLLDGDVFADGRYYFKVIASDRPSNPVDLAREAELVSAPVLIDNTPPVVNAAAPRRSGSAVEIDVDAEDRGSVLRRCEYSIDAGPGRPSKPPTESPIRIASASTSACRICPGRTPGRDSRLRRGRQRGTREGRGALG